MPRIRKFGHRTKKGQNKINDVFSHKKQPKDDTTSKEEEWISCQTDANKLVKERRPKKGSLFGPDESWPEEQPNATVTKDPVITTTTELIPSPKAPIKSDHEDGAFDNDNELPIPEEIQLSPEEKPVTEEFDEHVADEKTEILPEPEEWVIKKRLCRCCLVEGTFDSMNSPALGEDISYDGMLMKSFNIQLLPVPNFVSSVLNSVCGLCAARLRDAYAFRYQVIASEERFQYLYQRSCIIVAGAAAATIVIDLKEETPTVDNDDGFGMDEIENSSELLVEANVQSKPTATAKAKPKKKAPKKKKDRGATNEFLWVDDKYCTQCEMSFKRIHDLRVHFRKHRKELKIKNRMMKYKCTLCENIFTTKTKLNTHRLKEHNIDERYKCGACDRLFITEQHLQLHYNSYHKLGEKKKCSICDYECYSQGHMKNHMVKHSATKNFRCKYCEKSFPRKKTLHYHERIHTGDKRKVCAECGLAFVQKASLNYHMTKHHPEVKF